MGKLKEFLKQDDHQEIEEPILTASPSGNTPSCPERESGQVLGQEDGPPIGETLENGPIPAVGSWVRMGKMLCQVVSAEEGKAVVRHDAGYGPQDYLVDISSLRETAEIPPPVEMRPAKYNVGDLVSYSNKTALDLRKGTVIEVKTYPVGPWYRLMDRETSRKVWVSEVHITRGDRI